MLDTEQMTRDQKEYLRLLLSLIEDTHALQTAGSQFATYAQIAQIERMPFSHYGRIATMAMSEIRANATAINASLMSLGGIRYVLQDSQTKKESECVYESWQGLDPTQITNHLWQVRPLLSPQSQTVSVGPELFTELRSRLD